MPKTSAVGRVNAANDRRTRKKEIIEPTGGRIRIPRRMIEKHGNVKEGAFKEVRFSQLVMKIKAINAAGSNVYCLALNTEPEVPPASLGRVRISWVNDDVLKNYIPFITADHVLKLHSSTPISLNVSRELVPALEKLLSEVEKAEPMAQEEKEKAALAQETLHQLSRTLGIPIE